MTHELTLEPAEPAAESNGTAPNGAASNGTAPSGTGPNDAASNGTARGGVAPNGAARGAVAAAVRTDLRIAPAPAGVDLEAARRAAADFLAALGMDLSREELRETPARMARAYAELFDARAFKLTTFPNDEGYDELVLARDIPFRTVCEHHLLPFSGVAHVGYLPGDRILGLSKLARVVEHFAARPQTQERLTRQVTDCLTDNLRPRGAGVVLAADHTCMTLRGVRALGATTVTSALAGTLRDDARSRAEFFALAGVPG